MPKSYTGNKIGNYYPTNRINALLGNEGCATEPGASEEYKDLLLKLVKNKGGSRESDRAAKSQTRGLGLQDARQPTRNYFSNTQLPSMKPLANKSAVSNILLSQREVIGAKDGPYM
jgi:hypothetical protein